MWKERGKSLQLHEGILIHIQIPYFYQNKGEVNGNGEGKGTSTR